MSILGKRQPSTSLAEKAFRQRNKIRPHAFESTQLQTIVANVTLLNQMGFLDPDVLANEQVNRIMADNDSAMSSVRKRGRPRKFDLTFEDMMK